MIGIEESHSRNPEIKRMNSRLSRWGLILITVALAAVAVLAIPSIREPVLRSVGGVLVAHDAVGPADVIVISSDSGGAGALQAADLAFAGIASRVAVFADPPSGDDLEFIRRGLPYEDAAARQIRQLKSLGVMNVMQIPRNQAGSGGEGEVLAPWCEQHGFRSIVFVASRDHSRRIRRILDRAMKGRSIRVMVQPELYSNFDPDRWWKTHGGIRTQVFELQKLVLDVVLHPID
jgi:hypothetical protein